MSAILFSPRGGSAHAARALATALRAQGCSVTLVAGSRRDLGGIGDAREFYGDVQPVDFDAALASDAPMRSGDAPMHPSFEDRPGAPDRVFAALDDLEYEWQVRAWSRALARAGAANADVLHLHHLTPLNEAAARVAPSVPVVGQLHGTELLMLERIAAGAPEHWRYAERWAERLRTWAARCARLIVVPAGVERASRLLELPPERFVALPNGVDLALFRRDPVQRRLFWHEVLVARPRGWLPDQLPGSARYGEDEVARLAGTTVLLYVGRFTAVKRLDRLIAAFAQAKRATDHAGASAALVLVGGHPGEWEGEHPAQIAARLGVPDVFLAGWYEQQALPGFFSAADAVVLASEREQFGQVLIEGMACGLPAVASRSLGPATIVEHGRTGWLAEPEGRALAGAMIEAVTNPRERERRGRLAAAAAAERYSWTGIASRLISALEDVTGVRLDAAL